MTTSPRSLALALTLAAAALLGAFAPAAHAQSGTPRDPYVITGPTTITKAGYYILGNSINSAQTSGNVITISANNVTLDFNGFYIAGPAGNTGQQTIGVRADEQSNIIIKNGTIAYCLDGIYLTGNGNANTNAVGEVVDNMHVTYCYYVGISVYQCPASRITNCQVSQIGFSATSNAIAINGYQSGTTIQNNTVSNVTGTNGVGIRALNSFARQNTISNATYGVVAGTYQDNLTSGCTTPFSGGTDAGGNF